MLSNTLWEYATKVLIVTVATQKLVEQKSKSVHGYKLKITHTTTEQQCDDTLRRKFQV